MAATEMQYIKTFKDVCKKINASLDVGNVLKAITETR